MSTKEQEKSMDFEPLDSSSVDSFIKELEEKEKYLDISSDLVIEVGESEVDHNTITDEFFSNHQGNSTSKFTVIEFDKSSNFDTAGQPVNNEEHEALQNELLLLKGKISRLDEEKRELGETLIRRQRDFDNHRSRTERERSETFRNFVATIATEMIPVLDNLDRALDSFSSNERKEENADIEKLIDGVALVNQQLNDVLSNMGINHIGAVGEPFDPRFHEAVETVQTEDFPPETVVTEILKGYRVDDKVIRASLVTVSSQKRSN